MNRALQPDVRPSAALGGALKPPEITAELAERSRATAVRADLGEATSATCNPGIGDADGDGLDEVAIPFNRGEEDVIALFRGDGERVWEITDAPFYHAAYDDDERYLRSHWHYRSRHRHLLTEIVDFDGDGEPEVVCGLGPIHVLDAATGALQRSIDLDGLAQLWTIAQLRPGGPLCIVAGVNHHGECGSLVAVDPEGQVVWRQRTEGMSFEDFIFRGDLTGDGRPEIALSMADAERFEVRDAAGETLWHKHVPSEIGPDSHVDCVVIGDILPEGRQLATSTGGCLFDADGSLLWTLRDSLEHGQHMLVVRAPDREEPLLYLNSKTERYAWGVTPRGQIEWEYRNFSRDPDDRILLTSACDVIDWSAPGAREIVQAELLRGLDRPELADARMTLYLTVLNVGGHEVAKIPYEDALAPGFNGAMCTRRANATNAERDDIVLITHNLHQLWVISPA